MSLKDRLSNWLWTKVSGGCPPEWRDRSRLLEWEWRHASPTGGVWAVTPPVNGVGWELWAPGTIRVDHPYPREGIEPAGTSLTDTSEDAGSLWLADLEPWMRPWIEEVAGGRVEELVEGVAWFGPENLAHEYVIYARVA